MAYQKQLFETVSQFDPAIDEAASNVREFVATRDLAHLKFLAGCEPTRYFLRLLPHSIFLGMQASITQNPTYGFGLFVAKVQGLVKPDGSKISEWLPDKIFPGTQIKIFEMADIDECIDDVRVITEMALVGQERHFLHKAKKQIYRPLLF